MCGRYAQSAPPKVIRKAFGLERVPEFPLRYNIAPSQLAPVICLDDDGGLACELMRWGLVPQK
jgi:putative SOS response-associated peptidase YedK